MTKEEALKLIGDSDSADWHVVPKTEHETFLTNFKETEVSKGIKDEAFKIHQFYEDAITQITGAQKDTNEKGSDFLKRQLSTLSSDVQSKAKEIEDLQKAVKDKSGDEALKLLQSNYDALQKKHQRALDEFKAEKESQTQEINRVKLMNQADHAMMGIKFLDSVPEDARKALIEIAKAEVVKDASFLNGTVVFLDENGDPLRDDQYGVITMEAKLKEKLKSIIDPGRKQPGVDVRDPVTRDEEGKVIVNVSVPDTIKTMQDLIEHLQSVGLVRGSDDYFEALKHWTKKLNIK
jgi:hypothetical protein